MSAAVDRQFASTLARGLSVLRCFTVNDIALGNRDIASRTGLPKATVSRLAYTLTTLGYLRFVPELGKHGRYALGSALISISHPLLANLGLRQLARASMHAMAEELQACVGIWMRERTNMVCIEIAQAARQEPIGPDIGGTAPIAQSLAGAAYSACVAHWQSVAGSDGVRDDELAIPNGGNRLLKREMACHARLGFCVDSGRLAPGTQTVASALRHPRANDIFVFTCSIASGSEGRVTGLNDLGKMLLRIVRATELALAESR